LKGLQTRFLESFLKELHHFAPSRVYYYVVIALLGTVPITRPTCPGSFSPYFRHEKCRNDAASAAQVGIGADYLTELTPAMSELNNRPKILRSSLRDWQAAFQARRALIAELKGTDEAPAKEEEAPVREKKFLPRKRLKKNASASR
jgi:hypothetical protein